MRPFGVHKKTMVALFDIGVPTIIGKLKHSINRIVYRMHNFILLEWNLITYSQHKNAVASFPITFNFYNISLYFLIL